MKPIRPPHVLALLAAALLSTASFPGSPVHGAEPPAILLWPDGAPGALGQEAADRPAIYIHRPPAAEANGAAVIVCPGGGYGAVMMSYEGHDVADFFTTFGVTGIVLKYRLAPQYHHPAPLQDAQRAIRYVRAHAADLGIDPARIGIMGFSAGGHLASSAGTHFDAGRPEASDPLERVSCRPDFLVLAYAVISMQDGVTHGGSRRNLLGESPDPQLVDDMSSEKQVTPQTPPAFLFHTDSDAAVKVANSLLFYEALHAAGVPGELHVYRTGPHGVGLDRHPGSRSWPGLLRDWMQHLGLLKK